jgi:hypothetical protein
LEASGAKVHHFAETNDFRKDYENLLNHIPYFDYYLYLGMDEGSLGTLDALSAGVPTIITPQGFHLDLPDGITHSIINYDDLEKVFFDISSRLKIRTHAVAGLTWENYAKNHQELWGSILQNKSRPTLVNRTIDDYRQINKYRNNNFFKNSFKPRRVLSFLSHLSALRSIRKMIDRIRFNR